MPIFIRCIDCNGLVDKRIEERGRHPACAAAFRAARGAEMRRLGPCPQELPCHHCGRAPATLDNRNSWDHHPVRFAELWRLHGEALALIPHRVVVSCRRCNEGKKTFSEPRGKRR